MPEISDQTKSAEQIAETTSGGEQNKQTQPSIEELSKQLDAEKAQKAEAIREMNSKQREAAQVRAELEAQKTMASTLQNQLAQFQVQPDPVSEARKQIAMLRQSGEYEKADEIQSKIAQYEHNESIRQVATVSLTNQLSAMEMNPSISEDAKKIIREMALNDPNNPDRGLRVDNLNDLLAAAVKPLGFKRLLDQAEERALGRKVRSGEMEKEIVTKFQEDERKRKENIAKQTSLTTSGSGIPPTPSELEEVKKQQRAWMDKVMSSKFPT